jgi:hypothetical protein
MRLASHVNGGFPVNSNGFLLTRGYVLFSQLAHFASGCAEKSPAIHSGSRKMRIRVVHEMPTVCESCR